MEIEVEVHGADEIAKALKEVEKKFPNEIRAKLDSKAVELEEFIGDDIERQGLVLSGRLRDSFEHYPPEKSGGTYVVRVTSKEKYAHLIEEGHELVLYSPKKKEGGKAHHIGRVQGYHVVENGVDRLNEDYIRDIETWMFNLIEGGIGE